MKYHQRKSNYKKKLFNAVLNKWNTSKKYYGIKPLSGQTTAAGMVNALGAAAFLTVGAMTGFANDDPTVLPEVVVSGKQESQKTYKAEKVSSPKYTVPLLDVPQTINVIPQSVIEDQGATTLRDVLRNVPGISIQAGEGGVPAGDNLSIRGFNARTDIFIDGVRDFGGYARDSFAFEQIEVTKGPASSYAGRGSTGGSVNMVSKAPRLDDFNRASVGVGTDDYQRYTMDLNQPIEKIENAAVRFNAMYHEADVPGRDVAHNQRWGFAPSVGFGIGTETEWTLSYLRLQQDNIPDYGIPWVPNTNVPLAAYRDKPAPINWKNYYGLKGRDFEKVTTDVVTGEVKHEFNDDLSLRNLLRYGKTYRDSIITSPRFASTASTDITRTDWKTRDESNTILTNQTDVTIKVETAGLEHTFVPGLELSHETDVNYGRVKTGADSPTADLYSPDWNAAYLENIQRDGSEVNATSDSIGVYVFDTMKIDEQWSVNGGLRWDYFNLDYLSIPAAGAATNLGRIDRTLSWQTGVVYKPQENGSIYAAYGTSFNPSAEGLALSTTLTAANNVNVDPEESHSIELGTKWEVLERKLSLGAAIFRTDKTNARTEDPAEPNDIVVLEGEQRVNGLELSLTGNITDQWAAFAGYTFLMSEIRSSKNTEQIGEELGNTPKNTFNLWTTYDLPMSFQVGGGVQFVDQRSNNNASSRQADAYVLGDAMLAYKVNDDITMRLNAYNVGDAEYLGSLSGGHAIPGAGRSAVLSTDFKF